MNLVSEAIPKTQIRMKNYRNKMKCECWVQQQGSLVDVFHISVLFLFLFVFGFVYGPKRLQQNSLCEKCSYITYIWMWWLVISWWIPFKPLHICSCCPNQLSLVLFSLFAITKWCWSTSRIDYTSSWFRMMILDIRCHVPFMLAKPKYEYFFLRW